MGSFVIHFAYVLSVLLFLILFSILQLYAWHLPFQRCSILPSLEGKNLSLLRNFSGKIGDLVIKKLGKHLLTNPAYVSQLYSLLPESHGAFSSGCCSKPSWCLAFFYYQHRSHLLECCCQLALVHLLCSLLKLLACCCLSYFS